MQTEDATPLVPGQTKLVKAKTRRGKRFLESRAPKAIEDAKRALFLYGNQTSQIVKDVLTDLYQLKRLEAQKFTRKNENIRPFEPGGETSLEFYCSRNNCPLFVLGSHSKKRPHNVVIGRLFDFHLYDALELGVEEFKAIRDFGAAGTGAQLGNKPCVIFVGEKFESVPALALAKSLLLDMFRGEPVDKINLAGIDRVLMAVAEGDTRLQLRQYSIRFKKSGTRIPKVALTEMGPRVAFSVRRYRLPPSDLQQDAMKQPKLGKKKEKNVSSDALDGKVGRIYMPKQNMDTLGLSKYKGTKRERREGAREAAEARKRPKAAKAAAVADGGGDAE
ncbi:hypothetical protein VOLCADRAFT_107061 [Volvox carteri f. nagariensis]|uniref:Ribosome production factor 2 homolog n=1 Tax=Volvox carteri f. nagariensis TaxID=3068 RepID=D8UBS1_VOLCA|nr:uncharacterized protein VOLCADRAFT_107061 [Volvox carteri f. nagariensis]EFJ42816.1 hypothetical protein VOLCADRAFT_107061 [Volvox carteri f. nagariensis]|eukprot:XP_002956076.1 hypothetical protein VOLCADRAFT_107061 [Volvox carteri f. nagariensis]